jgi:hypothetical protein
VDFRFFILLAGLAVVGAAAEPGCPAVSFQAAYSESLTPTSSSHIVLLKQPDNSYTGYEVTNASPYTVLGTTPHFEKQLTACPPAPAAAPLASLNFETMARTASGNYLFVGNSPVLDVTEFDGNLNLISEAQYNIPPSGGSVILADVNGDGNLDIVIPDTLGDYKGAAVVVLLGNGGVNFQSPASYGISSSRVAGSIAIGDVNGDGKPDIVVSSFTAGGRMGKISVFLGSGDGTFQPEKVALSGLQAPSSLLLADFNGDGKLDLAFIDSGIEIAPGAGDGTFAPPVTAVVSTAGLQSLAVGDINGDGLPDLVANNGTILWGDGKGGFSNPRNYATEASGQVILTDFNGDGLTDIVIADGNASIMAGSSITVLFGRAGGTFFAPPLSSAPDFPEGDTDLSALRAADFNNDGIPDLVVTDIYGNVNILQGVGDGFFGAVFSYSFPDRNAIPWDAVTGDFNHDGNVDFAVVESEYVVSGSGSVQVFLRKGDGSFQSPLVIPAPLGAFSLVTADFNRDGKLDLAVLVNENGTVEGLTSEPDGNVLILLGNGDGTFTSHGSYTVEPGAQAIAVGDFNGDRTPDLAVVSVSTGTPHQNGDVLILTGKGDGTFTTGTDIALTGGILAGPGGNFVSLATTDLNGDGRLDLAVALSDDEPGSGELVVLLGHGDGTFQPPVQYAAGVGYVMAGDLNGDRIPDLIVTGEVATGYLLGNGDGTFQPEATFFYLSGFTTADFNGDGKLDIAGFSEGGFTGIATLLNTSTPPRSGHRPFRIRSPR